MRDDFSLFDLKQKLGESCLFCDPTNQGQEDQVIGQTSNFYLFVALGQIVEGYILIVSRRHMSCMAEMSVIELQELQELQEIVRRMYREVYGQSTVLFEHGMSGTCLHTSSDTKHCYHAHLHCAPTSVDLLPEISQTLRPIKVNSFTDILETTDSYPYFYYENSQKYVFIQNQPAAPQFLRQKLADAVNTPDRANWLAYPTLETVAVTRDKLSLWLSDHTDIYIEAKVHLLR